jgi:uncharacterized protein YfcZ (UPF0381/DUF406 family)
MSTYTPTVTHAFRPTETTNCWSVYVGAIMQHGGQYADGHGYGATRAEAKEAAFRDLLRKCEGEPLTPSGPINDDGCVAYASTAASLLEFPYATDSASGTVEAASLADAYQTLRAKVSDAQVADGATLWVEDPGTGERMTMSQTGEIL